MQNAQNSDEYGKYLCSNALTFPPPFYALSDIKILKAEWNENGKGTALVSITTPDRIARISLISVFNYTLEKTGEDANPSLCIRDWQQVKNPSKSGLTH